MRVEKTMLSVAVVIVAMVTFGGGLAPLNPAFEEWQEERKSMSSAVKRSGVTLLGSSAGDQSSRVKGLVPSPFDRFYLKDFYVDGEAVSPLKPIRPRLLTAENVSIPDSYDARVDGKGVTSVKQQNPYGTCWAHAACGCIESWLLNAGEGTFDFSENNMVNLHGRDWTFNQGGNGDVAAAYLLRWSGPVLESSDRYPNIGGSPENLEPALHLQNVKWIPGRASSTDNAILKKAVMRYGAVYVTYYHEPSASGGVDLRTRNAYWNPSESAYYRGTYHQSNHAVCIVGWDDGYSAGNFSTRPPADGAFLIKNSWGTGFGTDGNEGYCWISYYDGGLGMDTSYVFADTEDVGNYDDIYQYDPLGLVGAYGSMNGGSRFGAVMFTAREDLEAAAVGIYLLEPHAKYEISIYSGCSDGNPSTGTKLGSVSGSAGEHAGYMTVPVPCESTIPKGTRFSAVVKITTASTWQLVMEYPVENYSSGATAEEGETFYSANGTTWNDFFEMESDASFCCKVYTKRHVASSETYTVTFDGNGGAGSMADRVYSYGKIYALPPNAFTRDGYVFAGWKWSGGRFADCGEISFPASVQGPITLVAQWEKTAVVKPSVPVISEVTQGDLDHIAVTWTAVPGAKHYNLYWCAIDEFPSTQTPVTVTGTAYLDTERMPGFKIYYWVSAVNDAGESEVSEPMSGYRAATCSVDPVSVSCLASGLEGGTVMVEANTSWRAESSDDWIHIEDGIGPEGGATFSYTIDENVSTMSRTGSITVYTSAAAYRVTRTISVFQAGVSKPLPGVPEMKKTAYTSEGFYLSWYEASHAKTYKIYRSSNPDYFGTGETCIVSGLTTTSYIDATANWMFAYDYRVVAVNDEGETSGEVKTLQGKHTGEAVVIPSVSSGTFPAAGGRASVIVDLIGSDKWEASSSAGWLTLSTTVGSAGTAFTVTATENTSSSKRTATVLIGAGLKIGDVYMSNATVTFTQDAGDGSGGSGDAGDVVAQTEVTLSSDGTVAYGHVTPPAGEKWEFLLSGLPSWITAVRVGGVDMTGNTSFSLTSDSGQAWSIGVTAAENTGEARAWTMPIMCDGAFIGSVVIRQNAAGDENGSGTGNPDVIPVGGGTKTYYIDYTANEKWTFDTSRPDWVTELFIDGQEFSKNSISYSTESSSDGVIVVTVTASANAGEERKWSMPITCDGVSKGSVEVVQSGTTPTGYPALPDTPVAVAKDSATVTVAWTKADGATTYRLWRADDGKHADEDFGLIAVLTGLSYTDKGLKPETTYSYKVSALNATGETMCLHMSAVTTPADRSGGDGSGGGSSGGVTEPAAEPTFGPGEGSRFYVSPSEKAVVVGVSSLKWANFSSREYHGEQSEDDDSVYSFLTFDDPRIVDAEKNSIREDFDDCWCSALSEMNVFFWAGWIGGYEDEDAVKNYMRERAAEVYEDTYGFDYYDLVARDFSDATHAGTVAGLPEFVQAFEGADRLFCLTVDFGSDYIWKGEGGVSHGVVCCGYSLDTDKSANSPDALKGLFIIDSDSDMYNGAGCASAPDSITYCPVRWNARDRVYEIDNVFGATGTFSFSSMYYIRTRTLPEVHFTAESGDPVCRVTFDAGDGEFRTEEDAVREVKKNSSVGALPTPVLSKYKFIGWYTAEEGGTKISASTKVTDNVTYYARWQYDGSATVLGLPADGCGEMGKVTGGKMAKAGTKVTLKATANKGYVFAGWYEDSAYKEPISSDVADYRNLSMAYVVGEDDMTFYARFVPVEEDGWLSLLVNDEPVSPDGDPLVSFTVEGETVLPILVESYSLPKISVKGLPAGMKFTAKPIYEKGSKTEIEIPANSIYGTPTKPSIYKVAVSVSNVTVKKAVVHEFEIVVPNLESGIFTGLEYETDSYNFESGTEVDQWSVDCTTSDPDWKVTVQGLPAGLKWDTKEGCITGVPTKPGAYTVTFTAKKGKETEIATITLNIAALPAVAYGSFNGFLTFGDDGAFNKVGSLQLTVTEVGKMSAKIVTAAGTFSFSGAGWTAYGDGTYQVILETRKGEVLDLWLSPEALWNEDQITGLFSDSQGNAHIVSAQKTVFGQPWYFTAVGSADEGWRLVRTWDKKSADITVTVKDGATKLAGKIGGVSVNSSGFVNMSDFALGRMKASFTPVVTVNKVKKVLVVDALLSFDASVTDGGAAGFND